MFGLLGSSVGLVSVFHMTTCTPLSKTQLTNTDPPEAKTKTSTNKARDIHIPDKSQQSSSPPPLDSTNPLSLSKSLRSIKKREIIDQSSPPWPQTSSPYPLSVKTNWSRPLHPRLHFWLVVSCISFLKLLYCNGADIGPLLAKCDDPKMGQDPGVAQVVKQLDQACKEAGFFYVVLELLLLFNSKFHPWKNNLHICFNALKCYVLCEFVIDQKGHGIPETLLKEVKNLTRKFFELPYEEKTKIKMTAVKGYRFSGITFFKYNF